MHLGASSVIYSYNYYYYSFIAPKLVVAVECN